MYFSRISLKPNAAPADYAEMICQDSYKEHQILWKLFNDDPNAKRDFIYRYEPLHNNLAYYIVSKRKPLDQEYLWDIQTKKYAPILSLGQQLAFIMRVNPVITKDGKRHDIVMHEKRRINYKAMPRQQRPSPQELVEKTGYQWLQSRAEKAGFSIDNTAMRIDGYRLHTTGKKKGKKAIRYNTMDFRGILQVTDIDAFERTLMGGMGKSKAFGCGLMLIRRA